MPIRDIFDKATGKKMGEAHGDHFHPTTDNVPGSFDATDNFGRSGRVSGSNFTEIATDGGNIGDFFTGLISIASAITIFLAVMLLITGVVSMAIMPFVGPIVIVVKGGWKKTWKWFRALFLISLIYWALTGHEMVRLSQLTEGICEKVYLSVSGDGILVTNESPINISAVKIPSRQENQGFIDLATCGPTYQDQNLHPNEECTQHDISFTSLNLEGVFVDPPDPGSHFLRLTKGFFQVFSPEKRKSSLLYSLNIYYFYIPCS